MHLKPAETLDLLRYTNQKPLTYQGFVGLGFRYFPPHDKLTYLPIAVPKTRDPCCCSGSTRFYDRRLEKRGHAGLMGGPSTSIPSGRPACPRVCCIRRWGFAATGISRSDSKVARSSYRFWWALHTGSTKGSRGNVSKRHNGSFTDIRVPVGNAGKNHYLAFFGGFRQNRTH